MKITNQNDNVSRRCSQDAASRRTRLRSAANRRNQPSKSKLGPMTKVTNLNQDLTESNRGWSSQVKQVKPKKLFLHEMPTHSFKTKAGRKMPGAAWGDVGWLREPMGVATRWTKQLTTAAPSPAWSFPGLGAQARSFKQSRKPAKNGFLIFQGVHLDTVLNLTRRGIEFAGGHGCAATMFARVAGTWDVASLWARGRFRRPALRWRRQWSQRDHCHQPRTVTRCTLFQAPSTPRLDLFPI